MEIVEKKIIMDDSKLTTLLSANDQYVELLQNRFKTAVLLRGNNIILKGHHDEIKSIERVIKEFVYLLNRNGSITINDVVTIIDLIDVSRSEELNPNLRKGDPIIYHGSKDIVRARSPKQAEYLSKVLENDLVFSIGPAGTGKTFLAVAMALASLRRNEVSRIILTRPAVEAGESLGFLPGDMKEKIDPYLRPLMDALHHMLSGEKMKMLLEKNTIEITPLAYMRGRTLNNAFIILDEAQNATSVQMKMFLTRLGANSKAVVTGDVTQVDLQDKGQSGLINAQRVLKNIKGIEFVYFDNTDVVRHKLVADIIRAYENESDDKKIKKMKKHDNVEEK